MQPKSPYDQTWVDPRQDFRKSLTQGIGSFARAPIKKGEVVEIQEDWLMGRPCRCGAPDCRRTITGNDWQLPQVQQRYYPHFSPFVNRRIESST